MVENGMEEKTNFIPMFLFFFLLVIESQSFIWEYEFPARTYICLPPLQRDMHMLLSLGQYNESGSNECSI